ncbi:MAG: SigE family RNA polymerase sigma factor [Terracoccus sp.]
MSSRTKQRDARFATFMNEAGPALLRTAWLLTGDHNRAQELTQAALVKTYVAWPRVRPGEALAYARKVLVNHRTDTWRSTHKEVTTVDVPEAAPGVARDATVTVDNRDLVVRLLRDLPEQQRKIVVLRYYTDLSERATADALGISVGAVKSAASRGLAAVRRGLPTPPDDDPPTVSRDGAVEKTEPREGSHR